MPHVFHYVLGHFCRCFYLKKLLDALTVKKKKKLTKKILCSPWLQILADSKQPLKTIMFNKKSHSSSCTVQKEPRRAVGLSLMYSAISTLCAHYWSQGMFCCHAPLVGTTVKVFFLLCYLSKKSLHPLPPESHPAAARSMKLLAKIPKDSEAVIVLVGKLLETLLIVCRNIYV